MNKKIESIKQVRFPGSQYLDVERRDLPEDTALKLLWDAVDAGIDIYHAAVAGLAVGTGCKWVAITNLMSDKECVTVKAMWDSVEFTECHEYAVENTPCDLVLKSEEILVFDNVTEKFPQDEYLRKLGVEDYMGLSFRDKKGQVIGHITLMHHLPFSAIEQLEKTLSVVASAVALEF